MTGRELKAMFDEHTHQLERLEKKHGEGSKAGIALLYLGEKRNAIARGRLTPAGVERIEHMFEWWLAKYSEDEISALHDEIWRLVTMAVIDDKLETIWLSPRLGNE